MKRTVKILAFSIIVLILFIGLFVLIEPKPNYKNVALIENSQHPGKKLMQTYCYACHNPETSHDNRLAPPMIAVKKHYKNKNTTKKEFIDDFKKWIKTPSEEISKMPGAIKKFGMMPYAPYAEEDIEQIADYIYDNDIEQPEWFEEHHKKEMKEGKGRGMQNRKGKMKQQQSNSNNSYQNLEKIGMHYALATKKELGKNLMGAIQKKGTVGALRFCNEQALSITDSMSNVFSVTVKRVSDKPRNPLNAANAKELKHIKTFKNKLINNANSKPIVEETNNNVSFYYPITTNMMCLQCHGKLDEHIQPKTYKEIKLLYPNDMAIGYGVNEVRGIWSVKFNTK